MLKQLATGAAWMVAFRLAERSLGLVSTMILARLLVPDDFGLVAMAMSVIALIELASAFGFDTALIQHRDPQRPELDTAFTLNAVAGLGCAAIMVLCARPTAAFYGDERIVDVMQVLALAWAVQGFENVGTVMFRRNLQFQREFVFLTSKRLLQFVATLIAAFALRSYWALVVGMLTGRIAMVVLSYVVHPYRPRFSLRALRALMSFSIWLFLTNVLAFFNTRLSSFVIGRLSGSHALGLYTLAYEIGTLPTSELLAPVNRAIIPGFARMAHDRQQLRGGFLEVLGATTLFALPAAFGIAAVAEPLVLLFLTSKWAEVIPLLKVLALLGAFSAITSNVHPAYYALGRPHITTALSAMRFAIILPAMIYAGLHYGVLGVAWAELVAAMVMLPVSVTVVFRVLDIGFMEFVSRVWRPVVASIAMYLGVQALVTRLGTEASAGSEALRLAAGVGAGVVIYVVLVLALWAVTGRREGAEARLMELARAKLAQRFA